MRGIQQLGAALDLGRLESRELLRRAVGRLEAKLCQRPDAASSRNAQVAAAVGTLGATAPSRRVVAAIALTRPLFAIVGTP